MASLRTQIYLTAAQRERLDELRERDGKALAEVIRDAIDAYVAHGGVAAGEALDTTFGAAPQIRTPSRDEWTRG